jgi:hypothetical protein
MIYKVTAIDVWRNRCFLWENNRYVATFTTVSQGFSWIQFAARFHNNFNILSSTSSSPKQWPTFTLTITTLQALFISHMPRNKYKFHSKVQHSRVPWGYCIILLCAYTLREYRLNKTLKQSITWLLFQGSQVEEKVSCYNATGSNSAYALQTIWNLNVKIHNMVQWIHKISTKVIILHDTQTCNIYSL